MYVIYIIKCIINKYQINNKDYHKFSTIYKISFNSRIHRNSTISNHTIP